MIIHLPDGSQKRMDQPCTVLDVARSIGPRLAKAALAAKVNHRLVDLDFLIKQEVHLQIITGRDPEGLEIIRHSTAHLLAHAIKILFPSAQIAIGPVIDNGFYYDVELKQALTPDDLDRIEKQMQQLAKADYPVKRQVLSRKAAIQMFKAMKEHYKVDIIHSIPDDEAITCYQQDTFIDLCRGPHVPRTSCLAAFKLTKLSGAYWKGDASQPMLQRIYGTAWPDKQSLKQYMHRLTEAEKRDHRLIGKKMDLFHFQSEAPGMVFWHPKGWVLNSTIRDYIREFNTRCGYGEISTPQIVDEDLWKQSGHLDKFGEEMFRLELNRHRYAIKPMNCPCHVQIFKQGLKSYRDLPLRYAEWGCCHRRELSGALHGLMRVRAMTQDDGHVFCTDDQIHTEVLNFIYQLQVVYRHFGFTDVIYKLSTRPKKRVGSDTVWDKAEMALSSALEASGVDWQVLSGEGAFYGPKIEFSLNDCLDRVWQCGTIQVDFSMPDRLGAYYIGKEGMHCVPVMLHRAILGSVERFIGILLEHYAGDLPLWLAPVQVVVMNITDRQLDYVVRIVKDLQNRGFRVIKDLRNEKISYKIREHALACIPYQLIIGDREVLGNCLSVRLRKGDTRSMVLEEFTAHLKDEIGQRAFWSNCY